MKRAQMMGQMIDRTRKEFGMERERERNMKKSHWTLGLELDRWAWKIGETRANEHSLLNGVIPWCYYFIPALHLG